MTKKNKRKSVFRSLFVPIIFIMIAQSIIFYAVTVYGGLESLLSKNAVDILNGQANSQKGELESVFNNRWTELDDCINELNETYSLYQKTYGEKPFISQPQSQIEFLRQSDDALINALRFSQANGVFLILNDTNGSTPVIKNGVEEKYGLCIRDMDPYSNHLGRDDLLLERSPSSIIDSMGCLLDSWWEAKYNFSSEQSGDYYYAPLGAAGKNPNGNANEFAYLANPHRLSGSDPQVISYSIPLLSEKGFPYGVLGVEISVTNISSMLPSGELNDNGKGCYVLAMRQSGSEEYEAIAGSGTMYTRCFEDGSVIRAGEENSSGGFIVTGKEGTALYAVSAPLNIYNTNDVFSDRELVLMAMVEQKSLFSYIDKMKHMLVGVSTLSLCIGVVALLIVSKRFASPITSLAKRVQKMEDKADGYELGRLGITEIDQLVESIEELNRNVSRNSARTEFFSRMSHDMRTPMNAIISFSSDEMLEGVDAETKDEYLQKIHGSGEYLLGLINEVLDMTKIESDKMELHPSAVQAAQLFVTPISVIENLANKKDINFYSQIDLPSDIVISVDEQRINQIVMNLLSNAVKFTNIGGKVEFSARIINEGAQKNILIVVSDSGIGMSKKFMKTMYTPFKQENEGREGTGLGLSITKTLVDIMGGTIDCESEKDVGSKFTVSIPLCISEKNTGKACAVADDTSPDMDMLKGKHVLVCEDNNLNVTIIEALLERVGMLVDVAENGAVGVEMFEKSDIGGYDFILMDIRMPIMNGLEATKKMRVLRRPDARSIPIIAMTADAFSEDEVKSSEAGMNEHLSKPVNPQKLYDTLLKYV